MEGKGKKQSLDKKCRETQIVADYWWEEGEKKKN